MKRRVIVALIGVAGIAAMMALVARRSRLMYVIGTAADLFYASLTPHSNPQTASGHRFALEFPSCLGIELPLDTRDACRSACQRS